MLERLKVQGAHWPSINTARMSKVNGVLMQHMQEALHLQEKALDQMDNN